MSKLIKSVICIMIIALPLVGLSATASFAKSAKQQEVKKEEAVYVTTNGKKYHKDGCRFITNRETTAVSEEEAIAEGLTPCGRCFKEKVQAKE